MPGGGKDEEGRRWMGGRGDGRRDRRGKAYFVSQAVWSGLMVDSDPDSDLMTTYHHHHRFRQRSGEVMMMRKASPRRLQ